MINTNNINQIDIFKLNIERLAPFRISLGTMTHVENILVRIQTSEGLYGLGEGSPVPFITGETQEMNFAAAKLLGTLLLGKNPLAIGARMAEINEALTNNTTIKSAFDIALYDLAGKTAGLPLYAFLGGDKQTIITDDTVTIETPEKMAQKAAAIIKKGFPAVKVKLGTDLAGDVARIKAVRGAIGPDVPLRIDANQGWDVITAVNILRLLEPYQIQYCEEPVASWDNQGMATVRQNSPIPIMADESLFDHHDAYRLAAAGACDYFNIKLSKSGGIYTALKIDAVGEAAGIPCMVGCMFETRLATSAAAHLVSARPNIIFADLDSATGHAADPIIGGIHYDGGQIQLPETPGHGADIDPAFLEQMEMVSLKSA